MERWLVMSDCQTVGLANCLQAQVSGIEISPLDPGRFNSQSCRANYRMRGFDRLLINPAILRAVPKAKINRITKHVQLPSITFRGYHPDLIYIFNRGRPLGGPTSHYHSAIVYACYLQGIGPADVTSYFNGHFFERCGYFNVWAGERDRLFVEFESVGLNIRPYFGDWGRRSAFMYSYNHPRIQPLYDMASELLKSLEISPNRSDLFPHDNLAGNTIFAVYPEIGEALGVRGQYEFRAAGNYRSIDLNEYIGECYLLYDKIPDGDLEPFPEFKDQVNHIKALL